MDRLDYLRRDSFYTGVTEGNIGSARIIKMLDVKGIRTAIPSFESNSAPSTSVATSEPEASITTAGLAASATICLLYTSRCV